MLSIFVSSDSNLFPNSSNWTCTRSHSVSNFSGDVKDGENYTVLLNQLAPESCSRAPLQEGDLLTRAELILQNAEKLDCRKYLSPQSMVAGNPKLNLAFVANLFNTHPGLDPVEEVERPELPETVEDDREARGNWRQLGIVMHQWSLRESCLVPIANLDPHSIVVV
jgi:plastin-1